MPPKTRGRLGIAIAVLFVALVAMHASAAASTVRGQLFRMVSGKRVGANGIAVRLNHAQRGPSSSVYTNNEGMYFLYNIPPGQYTLEVTITQKNVQKYRITVEDKPYTDIAPIEVK
jgi:ER membrane protein complex subunit 7, beta-sandwich domain